MASGEVKYGEIKRKRQFRINEAEKWHRRFREGRCCIEDDDRIVTTDITWLWDLDPETKAQSCIWKTPETSSRIKARGHKSGRKHMFMFLMIKKDMLLQHHVPDGQTVTASYYSKVSRFTF
ncbi:uncharacterized protein LOC128244671 isoform X4 [Mya arenaria]|uniref:uncharacterized protein LOC128244671 isoform X4 n=1 Tax=Mya arenaria TaxID=6604 RepID=UPI0022DF3730|nr:uncharacterized protein LOC128244671 isoform X4 [Mya arenaria]